MMHTSEKIELEEGGYFLIQIEEEIAEAKPSSGGIETTSTKPMEKITAEGLRYLRGTLRLLANNIYEGLKDSNLQECKVELNIGFKGLGAIPILLKDGAEASLKITATWKK